MATETTATSPSAEPAARIVDGREQLPFGVLLARLGQESMARFRKALRPLEITAQQYVVLKQLQAFGTASQATLADALGLDYSNLATVTGELSDAGLIERYRHESDRRRYVIELSEQGSELVEKCDKELYEGEEEMLGNLSDADRERFWGLLREVADNANLCPSTPVENAAACAGEDPPVSRRD
jgi:MarR family transcriptional regulator, lower aerobic nicotinate degradation pathway regulator